MFIDVLRHGTGFHGKALMKTTMQINIHIIL